MSGSFAYSIVANEIVGFPSALYRVTVRNGKETIHEVLLSESYWKEITYGNVPPLMLIEQSFRFLLSRESQESILPKFSLHMIESYFPEYREEIQKVSREVRKQL